MTNVRRGISAKLLHEEGLTESCLKTIDDDAEAAMSCEDFLEIDFPTLCEVLKRDTLKVEETALFDAVLRWASTECSRKGLEITIENQRSLLEGALRLIRFPIMNLNQFTTTVAKSGISNNQELVDMYYYFSGCSEAPSKYNTTPRSPLPKIASRFVSIVAGKDYEIKSNEYQGIDFSFSKSVKLLGFGLYTGGTVEDYNLNLLLCENKKLIYKEDSVQFVTTGHQIHRYYLKTAITAMADVSYCILIRSKDNRCTLQGSGEKTEVTVTDPSGQRSVNIRFLHDCYYLGQLPKIIFHW